LLIFNGSKKEFNLNEDYLNTILNLFFLYLESDYFFDVKKTLVSKFTTKLKYSVKYKLNSTDLPELATNNNALDFIFFLNFNKLKPIICFNKYFDSNLFRKNTYIQFSDSLLKLNNIFQNNFHYNAISSFNDPKKFPIYQKCDQTPHLKLQIEKTNNQKYYFNKFEFEIIKEI